MDSSTLCFVVVLAVIIGVLVVSDRRRVALERERAAAQAAYEQSLSALKRDPTNADVKQQTLGLGRAYSNLTRGRRGVALFDEVALSNDISAATAAAAVARPLDAPPPAPGASAEARLAQLEGLRAKGVISEEEYQARRSDILRSI